MYCISLNQLDYLLGWVFVVVGGGVYVLVQQVFSYILAVILTGGENQSTRSKNTDLPAYNQQAYPLQCYRVF
jgi:hypothetical protein